MNFWHFYIWDPVGTLQLPFVFNGSAAGNLRLHLLEDAISSNPWTTNGVCCLCYSFLEFLFMWFSCLIDRLVLWLSHFNMIVLKILQPFSSPAICFVKLLQFVGEWFNCISEPFAVNSFSVIAFSLLWLVMGCVWHQIYCVEYVECLAPCQIGLRRITGVLRIHYKSKPIIVISHLHAPLVIVD